MPGVCPYCTSDDGKPKSSEAVSSDLFQTVCGWTLLSHLTRALCSAGSILLCVLSASKLKGMNKVHNVRGLPLKAVGFCFQLLSHVCPAPPTCVAFWEAVFYYILLKMCPGQTRPVSSAFPRKGCVLQIQLSWWPCVELRLVCMPVW